MTPQGLLIHLDVDAARLEVFDALLGAERKCRLGDTDEVEQWVTVEELPDGGRSDAE